MKMDFIPKTLGDLDALEENFLQKFESHAIRMGIEQAAIDESREIILSHKAAYFRMNEVRQLSLSANEDHKIKKERAIMEIRRMANKLKASKLYEASVGLDLGIVGIEREPKEPGTMKPQLTASFNGKGLVLRYIKGVMDGARIYSRIVGENEFTLLATELTPRYVDTREKQDPDLPEQREYYAIFLKDYSETGFKSDVLKVTIP